eukprot:2401454-Alexandrium_andersonii.AAC.1
MCIKTISGRTTSRTTSLGSQGRPSSPTEQPADLPKYPGPGWVLGTGGGADEPALNAAQMEKRRTRTTANFWCNGPFAP